MTRSLGAYPTKRARTVTSPAGTSVSVYRPAAFVRAPRSGAADPLAMMSTSAPASGTCAAESMTCPLIVVLFPWAAAVPPLSRATIGSRYHRVTARFDIDPPGEIRLDRVADVVCPCCSDQRQQRPESRVAAPI